MNRPREFQIDVARMFSHLPNAPIVEGVIHWQAAPGKSLNREAWKRELAQRFDGYSLGDQQQFETAVNASNEGLETHHRTLWGGFRLTSSDGKYVCQIMPNGLVVSRLAPYENWSKFAAEAFRFWDGFVDVAAPAAVDRLNVRFINQIALKAEESASDVLNDQPDLGGMFGFYGENFFRQDTLQVPGHPYRVTLMRGLQEPLPAVVPHRSLIVGIDAFSTEPISTDKSTIERHLKELRFLKNFVFFHFVKEAEKRFGGIS